MFVSRRQMDVYQHKLTRRVVQGRELSLHGREVWLDTLAQIHDRETRNNAMRMLDSYCCELVVVHGRQYNRRTARAICRAIERANPMAGY